MSGSYQYGNLCSEILKETYGHVAEKVAMTLFRCGPRTLSQIITQTRLPSSKVIKALKGLCNYNLVRFTETTGSAVTYSLESKQVTFLQRYIRSVPLLTNKFGSEGETLLDVLQKNGHETASGLVLKAAERLIKTKQDEMLAEALTSRIDIHAGNLARTVLSLIHDYNHSQPNFSKQVSLNEIRTQIQKQFPDRVLQKYLEDYLQVVVNDSSHLLKQADYANKMEFTVTLKSALEELAWAAIERSVQEQFGSNGVHVFRVVRLQRYVDQEQIQEAVMLTAKETKQITYRLMAHNLLQVRELKLAGSLNETGGRGGATTFLFCINLKQIARMFLEKCYVAQYAAMTRQNEVLIRFKYLFTKQQQMEAYRSVEVTSEHEDLFEDLLTPIEREELDKAKIWRDRLNHAACDIDESTMLFELFLQANMEDVMVEEGGRRGKK
ncbi:hypothetical protein B566_EDAN009519 [Ephemera danica]|nr:hypothetical protein B566_EDAN009519 [Ephemera danica]